MIRIAKKSRHDGTPWSITLWSGAGKAERWQSRINTAPAKLDRLRDWLAAHGVEDCDGWIAQHAPEIIDRATKNVLAIPARPVIGKSWGLYGHIAIVRPENGGFTVDLGIHGGTQSGVGGHWQTLDSAIAGARTLGARQIVCAIRGENGGDCSREWRVKNPDGVFQTTLFRDSYERGPTPPVLTP